MKHNKWKLFTWPISIEYFDNNWLAKYAWNYPLFIFSAENTGWALAGFTGFTLESLPTRMVRQMLQKSYTTITLALMLVRFSSYRR
ncbi:MAG: hypothetical protein J0L56_09280 [Chitinophagales bacterium]|nr:hypothetical protein [Chitinophagales bacterium]